MVLPCTVSVGVAFTDAVSEVSFLLSRLFRPVKGIQCVPEPQLGFLLIFPASLTQHVHSADVITGVSVSSPCFHHQKGQCLSVIRLFCLTAIEVPPGQLVAIRPPIPSVAAEPGRFLRLLNRRWFRGVRL